MSAFIVARAHIDALVTLAVRGPAESVGTGWLFSTYYHGDHGFEVNNDTADRIGSMLWQQNVRSVNHRYRDNAEAIVEFEAESIAWVSYMWPMRTPRLAAVAGLKACDCYRHQTCETSDWKDTEAHTFIEALKSHLTCKLPGYDEAAWSIA